MFRNYLKTAIRNLARNRTFSVINIFGLSFALACCLLMILFIKNELNYDRFNKNASSIYRVAFSNYLDLGGHATTPMPIGPALKQQMPEVKAVTRIDFQDPYLVKYETNEYFEPICFADEDVFKIFSFPLIEGDPNTALKEPNSIVISEQMAKKYFGNTDPLNKILKIGSTGILNCAVKGVFKNLPQNSQLRFDCLVSSATMYKAGFTTNLWQQMPANYTYVLLNHPGDAKSLASRLPAFVKYNDGDELKPGVAYNLILQPLADIHLRSHLQGELPGAGDSSYIYLFAAIAFIILLIACINFLNFAAANAIKRTKEIGIRKVIGAERWQVVRQFLIESFFTYFLAVLGAILLTQLLLPVFNQIAGKSFASSDIMQPAVLIGLIMTGVVAGLVAGFIPAWSISRVPSLDALRGKAGIAGSKIKLRRALVTVQFIASLSLIVCAAVVYQQMQYIRQQTTLTAGEQVIVFPVNNNLVNQYEALKNQLKTNGNIVDVTATTNAPGFTGDSWPVRLTESSPPVQTENYVADDNFLSTMNIPLLAGRALNKQIASDVKNGFVLNETAVHELGFRSVDDAIGKQILWGGGDNKKRGTILGVVKDFHFQSLHEKIAPALFQFAPYDWMTYNYILVKLRPVNFNTTINFIGRTVSSFDAGWLVDYKFFDENFQSLHKKDEQQGQIFAAFAIVAILISCLGLFGLTIYATQQRVKEIGIRKVLGASVGSIVNMLSKDFIRLVVIATCFAFPLAWWVMNKWLENFAYRVNIGPGVFVFAGLSVIMIAFLTVSVHAIKAASENPVRALRTE